MSISFSSVKPTQATDRPDTFPAMVPVRQRFFAGPELDTAAVVAGGLAGLDLPSLRGKKIALTAVLLFIHTVEEAKDVAKIALLFPKRVQSKKIKVNQRTM